MVANSGADPPKKPPDRRKLVAVLYADMVGYSRLIGLDDTGTLERLRRLRKEVIDPAIEEHGGRVVQTGGDSMLIVFGSIDGAVRCAVQVQHQIPDLDSEASPDRAIRFRVGIDIGDAIADGTDLHGDALNVAARLQAECPPGGICVTRAVRDHVRHRLDLAFEELGSLRLKNIDRPVEAFALNPAKAAIVPARAEATGESAVAQRRASLVPGFGERPAIAVLPFKHHGDDTEQEHFVDGITEDIITELARWRRFPVIARNSVFTYKGRDVDLNSVAVQLGVRYVVEGGLRRRGTRMRTSIQVVDVDTMDSLLAERYEYEIDDLFTMQDEIVHTIVGAIAPELLRHERDRAARSPQQNASAYELYQRGSWHLFRYTREDNEKARKYYDEALEIDPGDAKTSAGLAIAFWQAAHAGWAADRKAFLEKGLTHGRNAVQADSRDPAGHHALGGTLLNSGFPLEAIPHLREAVRLNPSHADAHANLAFAFNFLGRPDEALLEVKLALRLSPHDPLRFLWLPAVAISHYLSARYRDALAACQAALAEDPRYPVPIRYLVATLGQLARQSEARAVIPLLRQLDGDLAGTEAYVRRIYVASAAEHIVEGLRKAGLD